MPDYAMCADSECPSREICQRFKAIPKPFRQSWLPNMREKGWDRCGHFVQVEKVRKLEDADG